MLEVINGMNWNGACHQASATLYILLKENSLNAEFCSGVVKNPDLNVMFSHSWVEVNGEIYDTTIYKQSNAIIQRAPVLASYHLDNLTQKTNLLYGMTGIPIDEGTQITLSTPLTKMMHAKLPIADGKTWDVLFAIADKIGIKLEGVRRNTADTRKLTKKYENIYSTLRNNIIK